MPYCGIDPVLWTPDERSIWCPQNRINPTHSWPDTGTPLSLTAPQSVWGTFGDALRHIRIAEGLDQDELGSLLSVTGSAVSAWEHDTANPITSHYMQLLELFPALSAAPKPHPQDIQKPDGGKGIPRDGSGASTFLASVPLRDDPTEQTAAAHSVAATSTALVPARDGSPKPDSQHRVTVEQAGADYAQARLHLLRSEFLVVERKRQLSDAEHQVEIAKKTVQSAEETLKKAVADAAVQPLNANPDLANER
jgi:transcriptional regulator with XRE-family HTH domain